LHLARAVAAGLDARSVRTVRRWTLSLIGVLLALLTLNVARIPITVFAFLGGALAIGVGFGMQTMFKNFISGMILLLERNVQIGDIVEVEGTSGTVVSVDLRSSTVLGFDGVETIVPNSVLLENKVTNWTLSDRRRRIDVGVGVAYGTAPKQVLDLLLAVARAHPQVLSDPAPVALFLGFGDSALRFEMRVWTDRFDLWVQTQSELVVALYAALQEAGIEIPFPQREVRLRPG